MQTIGVACLYGILSIFTLLSILSMLTPHKLWHIMDSWKATSTPSRAYFIVQRIIGIIGVFASIGLWYMVYLIHTLR